VKVARWPAILLIVALIVAALLSGDGGTEPVTSSTRDLATLGPVVARADALSALWFCNGGTAVDNGIADHRVVLVNTTDAERSGSLTAYASKPATGARPQPVRRSWTLAPRTRAEYRLAEVVGQAAYASATVEVTGGGVLVEHSVSSPLGTDRGPCTSSASSTWWVPVGTTATVGDAPIARELLVFFNPFPGDAVVDVAFSTDSGFRGTPELFKGLVVPGGSVVGVDLASVILLQPPIPSDVDHRDAALAQRRGDQLAAVAPRRVLLGAHDHHPLPLRRALPSPHSDCSGCDAPPAGSRRHSLFAHHLLLRSSRSR